MKDLVVHLVIGAIFLSPSVWAGSNMAPDSLNYGMKALESARPIVFVARNNGTLTIAILEPRTGAIQKLPSYNCSDSHPAWSPNYQMIAFASACGEYASRFVLGANIYVMAANGTGKRSLTNTPKGNFVPRWSRDGNSIVFQSNRESRPQIFVMKADGSEQRNISNNQASDMNPHWSQVDDRIIFTSDRYGNRDVFVMTSDGRNVVRITNTPTIDEGYPEWSPDGQRVLFRVEIGGRWQLFTMNADGTGVKNITPDGYELPTGSWAPSGNQLLVTVRNGKDLFMGIMNSNGGVVTRLVNGFSTLPRQ